LGIALVADLLRTIMVVLSATMGLTVLLYSFGDIDRRREQGGYYLLFHLLLMGINGSFLTGDLFSLFVFFEVMLVASYVLLSLGGEPSQLQESFKYLVLNLLASTVFVASVGSLYSVTGTLNRADLALKMAQTEQSSLMTALSTAGVQEAQCFYVGVALLGSLLTLVSMSKIYIYVFWGEEKPKRPRAVRHADLLLPTAFLVLITMALGLIGEPVFQLAQQAATQLFSRETYIEAVFAAMQGAK
jgi:formate hydrogenlyase subunit 3/multisubunit Na+/H+ antiporter MnhD subunit